MASPADGTSFWAALTGQSPKPPRDAIFCSYNPMWPNFTPRAYEQDNEYKLYSDGQFFHFTQDPLEKQSLNTKQLDRQQRQHLRALKRHLNKFLPDAVSFLEQDNRKARKH